MQPVYSQQVTGSQIVPHKPTGTIVLIESNRASRKRGVHGESTGALQSSSEPRASGGSSDIQKTMYSTQLTGEI